jgi:O-antigen ligase
MAACALAARALTRGHDAPAPWLRPAALAALALVLAGTLAATVSVERAPGGADPRAGAGRLASVQSNRYAYWKVAATAFADRPLQGEGAGSFRATWLRERDFLESVRDAHSLYLETAAELGLGGLLALAVLIGGCAVAAVRAGPALPGAAAALAAFALHAGIDWDWEMPALTLVALALAGRLIAAGEPGGRAP